MRQFLKRLLFMFQVRYAIIKYVCSGDTSYEHVSKSGLEAFLKYDSVYSVFTTI